MTGDVVAGKKAIGSIPERRPVDPAQRLQNMPEPGAASAPAPSGATRAFAYPVWRCRVCGYLCARDGPPEICPICKAKKDRFERFA